MIKSTQTLSHKRKLIVFMSMLFVLLFIKASANEFIAVPSQIKIKTIENSLLFEDNLLLLHLDIVDSGKLLRVSFNGNEGADGELKIYDEKKELVSLSNFELIKTPFYATVDVTSLPSGSYSVVLSTKLGSHTSTLQIK